MDFPLHLTTQLREHLRALRKARGLTQASLGRLLGVGQARIAEIESNPGAVSVDQLLKVVSALRASLVLRDEVLDVTASRPGAVTSPPPSAPRKPPQQQPAHTPPTGQRRTQPLTGSGGRQAASVLASRTEAQMPSDAQAPQQAKPDADVTPTSRRNLIIRPKKGSW